jgi:uncharacterized metal-binding protein
MQVYLISCSGSCNVGQLANDGCKHLNTTTKMKHISALAVLAEKTSLPMQDSSTIVTLIEGCESKCLSSSFLRNTYEVKNHLIITDLGIEKNEEPKYTEEELTLVVDAIKSQATPIVTDIMDYAMSKPKCGCFS